MATRRQRAFDWALALVLAVWSQVEVWGGGAANLTGPHWANALAYFVAALLLGWRRRAPLAVLAALSTVLSAEMLAFGASQSIAILAPLVVGVYTLAAYTERRSALLGAAIAAAVVLVHELRDPLIRGFRDELTASAFWSSLVIAWLLGAYVRTRRLYVAELEARAERAEREREEQARLAVRDERARIARELHDVVAHSLGMIVFQAAAGDARLDSEPERARAAFRWIEDGARQALVEMRRLLGLLREEEREPALAPQPGLARLEELLTGMRRAGLAVDVRVDGSPVELAAGVDLTAYRIVQEALTNAFRHGEGKRASVTLGYRNGSIELEIVDGEAALAGGGSEGHGIVGMRERVALYGGEFTTGPRPEGGYRVWARLPAEPARP